MRLLYFCFASNSSPDLVQFSTEKFGVFFLIHGSILAVCQGGRYPCDCKYYILGVLDFLRFSGLLQSEWIQNRILAMEADLYGFEFLIGGSTLFLHRLCSCFYLVLVCDIH